MTIHYGGRLFRAVSTDASSDVDGDTIFSYEQRGDRLIASYSGGDIDFGSIIGLVASDGTLSFFYHHVTKSGDLRAGRCESTPEVLPSGKIRLHERWKWFGGPRGKSVIEEL
jgi:hypothetical protein